MSKFKDITGQKFGKLTVLHKLHNYKTGTGAWWLCVCDCGNLKEVKGAELRRGTRKSCGCSQGNLKHGKYGTRLYNIWTDMKQRCHNEKHDAYKNYCARGIAVCIGWRDNFQAFYNWAVNNGYTDTLTIDRINVNGNY